MSNSDPIVEEHSDRGNARRIDQLTKLLCSVCSAIDEAGDKVPYNLMPKEVSRWWLQRKEENRKRLEQEAHNRKLDRERKLKKYLKLQKELRRKGWIDDKDDDERYLERIARGEHG